MWAGFEWENKVTVHTNIDNLHDYLHHLVTVSLFLTKYFMSKIHNKSRPI